MHKLSRDLPSELSSATKQNVIVRLHQPFVREADISDKLVVFMVIEIYQLWSS